MIVVAQFHLCGISIKRAHLFGSTPHKMISFRFLIGSAHWVRSRDAAGLIRTAVTGLMEDPDWLQKNTRTIRLERRKAKAKVLAQMEAQYRDDIDWHEKRNSELSRRNSDLSNENLSLRRSIAALARDMEAQQ